MDQQPLILVEPPQGAQHGLGAETAAASTDDFAEPDRTILAWIASHVRKPPRSALM
jgi:hypothetical protein